MNIGGRPYHSWVSFIPPAFETTILFARVRRGVRHARAERPAAAVSPGVQRAERFARASQDKFFLAIEAADPKFDADAHAAVPAGLHAREVVDVDALTSRPSQKAEVRNSDVATFKVRREAPRQTSAFCLLLLTLPACVGCRQDMHDAPRYDPLESSAVFPKGSSAQPLVAGTVARGGHAERGRAAEHRQGRRRSSATTFPFAITRADLDRGEERFNIYCAPCHSKTGDGNGMVVQRGYRQAASYPHRSAAHDAASATSIDVMTNGFGAMPDYRAQITVDDRWRIVAYIKALQLSHTATAADVPAAELERLKSGKAARHRRRPAAREGRTAVMARATRTSGRRDAAGAADGGDRPAGLARADARRGRAVARGRRLLRRRRRTSGSRTSSRYIFWIGITLGSLGVLMVQHLSGGAWGLVSRRVLEAVDAQRCR